MKKYITAAQVLARYNISQMALWRWIRTEPGFPQPVYISRRRYWVESELDQFDASRPHSAPAQDAAAAA